MRRIFLVLGLGAAAAGVCLACTRDLDTMHGVAVAVNDSRVVVGFSYVASGQRAMKFPPEGAAVELPLPSGCESSFAAAISNQGEIAGSCYIDGLSHLVHWDATGAVHDLGRLGFVMAEIRAADINNNGLIVGNTIAIDRSGAARAWVYDTKAHTQFNLSGGPSARSWSAAGINDRGEIAGSLELTTFEQFAVKWSPLFRAITRLPSDSRCMYMSATGINSSGSVVGQCGLPLNATDPMVWPANGGAPRLLENQNEVDYYGSSINDEGTVVGSMYRQGSAGTTLAAVRWAPDGTRTTYTVPFTSASAINNFGYTVGARYFGPPPAESRPIAIVW